MARPRKEINELQVYKLAQIGCSVEEMAAILRCDDRTIQRRFATPLKEGRANAQSSVRRRQFRLAMEGNVTMLIWLGKQWLGQSDKQEMKHSGSIEHTDFSQLSDAQLDEVGRIIESASSVAR